MDRSFTTGVLISLLCLLASSCARKSAEPPFTLRQVGPNAWAAVDNAAAAEPAGGNAGFVIGDEAVAVIDTFWSVDAAKRLLAEIRTRTKLPVKYVVNTHYHLDHVAGNGLFEDAGATILAHRNVRGWIRTENFTLLGKYLTPELKAVIEVLVAPTVVFDQGANLYLGSRRIQVRSFQGHTGGDSIVVIPDSRIIFAGDLFFRNMLPNLIDASTSAWIDTLASLLAEDGDRYTFVPGHGDVGRARDVAAFREYLITLRALVAEAEGQGKSGDALAEAALPALKAKYGQWEFSDYLAKENLRQTDAELTGKKRIPRN